MEKINLNQGWKLHDSPLFWEKDKLEAVRSFQEGWLTCDVPADVRMPLIKEGIIKDPVVAIIVWNQNGWKNVHGGFLKSLKSAVCRERPQSWFWKLWIPRAMFLSMVSMQAVRKVCTIHLSAQQYIC